MHQLYRPFQLYFRNKRMRQFEELFHPDENTRIVDVGGYELNWTMISAKPQVVMVNLEDEERTEGRFTKTRGDARALRFPDNAFDIAYSNSVIEHVGDAADQAAFAHEIRRVAPRYYVQTPNRLFPVEPHMMTVGIHYLPARLQRHLVRPLSVWGWVDRPDQHRVDEVIRTTRLLDRQQLERLFPDAEILEESVLGLTKSLIAVRR